jgi:hypothetical protein
MRLAEYEGRRSAGDKVLTSHTKEQDKNAKDISSTFTELSQERKHELVNKISDDIKKSGTLIYTEDEKKRLDEARARETGQGYPGATSVAARAAANTLDTTTFGMAGAAAKLREQEAAEGRETRMKVEKEALDRQSKQFFDQMISMYETPEKMANQIEKLKKMGGFDDLIAQLEWVQNYGETMDESIDADQKKNEALSKKTEARHKQEEKTAKTKAESDTKAAEAKTKQIYDQEGQQHARSMLPAALRGEIGSEESIAAQLEKATGKKPSKEVLMATQTSLSDLYRKEVEKRSNETGETQDEAIESLRKKAVFDQARKQELEDDRQLPSEKKEDRADKKVLNERARNIAKAYGDSIQKTMKRHVEKQGKSIDESADQIEPQLIEYLKQQGIMGEDVDAAVKQVMGDMKVKRTVASTKRDMKRGPVKAPRTPRERPATGGRNPHRARDAMRQANDRAAEASDRKRLDKSMTPDENEVIKTLRSIDDHIKKSTQDIAKIATEGQYGKLA